jgi:hypothetical protein
MNSLHNIRNMIHNNCKKGEYGLIIDGDDELIGRQVFKLYNANYQRNNSLFVYANFVRSRVNNGLF